MEGCDLYIYENPAEYPVWKHGDECGAGARGMQSPSLLFKMPRAGARGYLLLEEKGRLISLHIYKKGYKQEHKKLKEIKTTLKKILEEFKNNECANVLPQDSNSSLHSQI